MEENDSSSSSSSSGDEEDTVAVLEVELRSAVNDDDVESLLQGLESLKLQCGQNEVKQLVINAFLAAAEQGKTKCLSAMMDSKSNICEYICYMNHV